jgi:hypothetical protein
MTDEVWRRGRPGSPQGHDWTPGIDLTKSPVILAWPMVALSTALHFRISLDLLGSLRDELKTDAGKIKKRACAGHLLGIQLEPFPIDTCIRCRSRLKLLDSLNIVGIALTAGVAYGVHRVSLSLWPFLGNTMRPQQRRSQVLHAYLMSRSPTLP